MSSNRSDHELPTHATFQATLSGEYEGRWRVVTMPSIEVPNTVKHIDVNAIENGEVCNVQKMVRKYV